MINELPDRPIPQYDRSTNEQDRYLDYCQRNEILIKVYLDSGRALQGKIVDHDRKCILLGATRVEKIPKMIPKSYIALVRAEELLPLFLEYKGRGNHITRKKARKAKKKAESANKAATAQVRKPRPPKAYPPVSARTGPGKPARNVEVTVKKGPRVASSTSKRNAPPPSDHSEGDGQ